MENLVDSVLNFKKNLDPELSELFIVSLKIDPKCNMQFVAEVKQKLRECEVIRITYSTQQPD